MRTTLTAMIAILMLAVPAQAQKPTGHAIPSVPAPRDPPPHFTIPPRGGALGPVGLPLPQIGLHPPVRPGEHGHRFRQGGFFPWPMMVLYVPQPIEASALLPESVPVEKIPALGRLILDVQPATAEVFADGYYVGTPDDFSMVRGGGLLEAGPHRIDVNATGFESMTVDLKVTASQSVTVRAALKTIPPPVTVPPTTFYLIPGCYMGNIPPKDAGLPATCDQSRVVTWKP